MRLLSMHGDLKLWNERRTLLYAHSHEEEDVGMEKVPLLWLHFSMVNDHGGCFLNMLSIICID